MEKLQVTTILHSEGVALFVVNPCLQ